MITFLSLLDLCWFWWTEKYGGAELFGNNGDVIKDLVHS